MLNGAHPSPLAGNKFQGQLVHAHGFTLNLGTGCKHFSSANTYLKSHGKGEITWDTLADDKS